MDAGVPVLGIPLFYDQPRNVENLVDLGVALSLDIENMTAATMWTAINRLLEDRRYTLRVATAVSNERGSELYALRSTRIWA